MGNRAPIAPDEWYHCYNRGVDKRRVFEDKKDYERFLQALYICNDSKRAHWDDLREFSHHEILLRDRSEPLVDIVAYSLMPNHFHLLLKSLQEKGIEKFMQKLGIAYTMYFNKKNKRVGNLFMRPYRSRHVTDDRYFKRLAQYIHLNAAELFEHGWKQGHIKNISLLKKRLLQYPYSSFTDYVNFTRPETYILAADVQELIITEFPGTKKFLSEAAAYYRDLNWSNK